MLSELPVLTGASELRLPTKRILMKGGSIHIRHVVPEDKGDYECRASNSQGEIRKTLTLILTGT